MTRTRSRIRSAATALGLSISFCVIAAEIVLRYLCTVCTWSEHNGGEYVSPYQEPSHNTWYHLRAPSTTSSYDQPEFDYELRTNSLGIRDVEHPTDKPPGELRIIGLGDSFTEGQGAPYESTYLKVLERNLNAKQNRVNVRIIVGGVAGSDPFYCYRLLKDKLLKFEPDAVTLTINQSDVMDVITRGGNERFRDDGTVRFAEPPDDEWIFARSHLYRVFLMVVLGHDWFGLSPSEHVARRAEAVEKMESIVGEFQRLGNEKNFRLLVILHPDVFEFTTASYAFDAEALKKHFAENAVNYVDLLEYFLERVGRDREIQQSLYWKKDFHLNEAGYRLFAEGLEEYLLANGFIEPPSAAQ